MGYERERETDGVKEFESSVSGNGRTRSSRQDRDTYIGALHGLQEGRNGSTSLVRVGWYRLRSAHTAGMPRNCGNFVSRANDVMK
ncbi:hypothetical protein M0802_001543 [Mischocyttarus mexicanus]|nr:hypothetical protein M0802_001543 [Mischocyttarus mexicanus]